jgi:hypothetical protein
VISGVRLVVSENITKESLVFLALSTFPPLDIVKQKKKMANGQYVYYVNLLLPLYLFFFWNIKLDRAILLNFELTFKQFKRQSKKSLPSLLVGGSSLLFSLLLLLVLVGYWHCGPIKPVLTQSHRKLVSVVSVSLLIFMVVIQLPKLLQTRSSPHASCSSPLLSSSPSLLLSYSKFVAEY